MAEKTVNVLTKKVVRNIKVPATDAEMLACGQSAAQFANEITDVEARKKAAMEDFKTQLDQKKGLLNGLLDQIRDQKIEVLKAECLEEFDVEAGMYRLTWLGRVVEERPMNKEERTANEQNIFHMAQQADKKKGKPTATETKPTTGTEVVPFDPFSTDNEINEIFKEETNRKTKKGSI